MALNTSPRPWTVTGNREIGDGAGNIVQYSIGNLGQICLAVNSYDKLTLVVAMFDQWLRAEKSARCSEDELRAAIDDATGRVGLESLAAMVEASPHDSAEIDRTISETLSVPQARYTDSADAAMSLLPKGAKYSMSNKDQIDIGTNEPIVVIAVDVKMPSGKTASAVNSSFARALAAAALRAHIE